jgi:hypothetical protein
MNRYSKTRLRQGLLSRQPPTPPEPEPIPVADEKDHGVAPEEQALLFDLSDDFFAPPAGGKTGHAKQ